MNKIKNTLKIIVLLAALIDLALFAHICMTALDEPQQNYRRF